ncbi:MAG TPA: serine/threonine-protein kinase, partial [Kofleriaceae bacterium]|nr:serine/threonine-protein kinase [Kofleriaceae bacterium]
MILGFVCRDCGQRADAPGLCPADGLPLLATDDPLLGHEIGRYRLARLLGEGGMGRVYLAVQPMIGSRVAIKILSDQCARSPELLERFFAEARAVNLIRHENIVSVMDLAKLPDGRPYIVMEFIEGQTLAEIVQGGPVPLGGLVQVASEIFSALAAAHAIGIVHRDLKPDNVLVTAEGHAKVLDFGIAKLAPQLQQQLSPRTQTGALLGTPQYMAPEQITGAGNVDARSDVYAAGVMLFEAITGGKPFRGDTLYDLMRAHLEQPPPSLRALRPELPAALEQVILTALAKAPEQRFQSVGAMNQAMQAAAQALPADQWRSLSARARASSAPGGRIVSHASRSPMPMQFLVTEPAVDPRARRPARRTARGWLLGGGLALALVLVLVGVMASQQAQPRPSVTVAPMPSADGASWGAGPLSGAAPGKVALPSVPAARGAAAVRWRVGEGVGEGAADGAAEGA